MAKLFKNFYSLFLILLNRVLLRKPDFSEKRIFLQGQLLDNINKQKTIITSFKDIEFSVFSQFGEDGIISWLVDKVPNIKKI